MPGGSSRRYSAELRERAVKMVDELSSDQNMSEWKAIGQATRALGVGTAETVRRWVRHAQIVAGAPASEESAELMHLRRENAELRRANALLRAELASVAARADGPPR